MQAVNKPSSTVSNKSSRCSLPWWIHSVRWCVQFFSNVRKHRSAVSNLGHLCSARKLLWRKILLRRGQRKVRLSEGWLILVSFHLFLVWAKSINSELIHPILKLPNYLKRSAQLSPFSRSRNRPCGRTATSTHFWSSRKHYIAHGQKCSRLKVWNYYMDTAFTTRFELKNKQ